MSQRFRAPSSLFLTLFTLTCYVQAQFKGYVNDFVDPDYIVKGNFGQNTHAAQDTIVSWARESSQGGPWSVMDKPFAAPSGDKHDYLSWAPYWWPDCSNVSNKAELTPQQVWTTCPYVQRDGMINPDARTVNDAGNFQSLADAVFYNSLAWALTKQPAFAETAANFIRVWFIDGETRMNPNVNYGQLRRGPGKRGGTHNGVLDLRGMTKIVNGILILRKSHSNAWTGLDNAMKAWVREYIEWLENTPIATEEARAANNQGTFYYNQLAALKLLLGDFTGARNAAETYFNTQYMSQIASNGEQPLESSRTRPYHYQTFNLAAMITNARLLEYADPNNMIWAKKTSQGATIKDAVDYLISIFSSASAEGSSITELGPHIAAVASVYGDRDGRYANFLHMEEPHFAQEAYFLWNQPFATEEGVF